MIKINGPIKIECPYCEHVAKYDLDGDFRELIFCDMETGGCDREFVIGTAVTVTVKTFKVEPHRKKKDELK